MRKLIAASIAVCALAWAGFSPAPVSADDILLNMADMVLMQRGLAVYDFNNDGFSDDIDLDLGLRHLADRALYDVILDNSAAWLPQYVDFCSALERESGKPVSRFSDANPFDIVPYRDGIVVERLFSVATGGNHGRIISMLDPYYTAIGYDMAFEPNTVLMTVYVYRGGFEFDECDEALITSAVFEIGSVSDFMEGGLIGA